MTEQELGSILGFAVDAAKGAGAILRSAVDGTFSVSTKSTATDMVTDVDTRAENYILGRIRKEFPGHGIVAEESGVSEAANGAGTGAPGIDAGTPYRWYVDPLDGTSNFVNGIPFFCTSIALYREEEPLVGVVFDPMRGECFAASAGGGARRIDETGAVHRMGVSGAARLIESIVSTGFPYDKHVNPDNNLREFAAVLPRVRGIRRFGSAALDCAYVAAGRLDGSWEFGISEWDIAAGRLLVTEAGGTVSRIPAPRDIHVFTNGRIHGELTGCVTAEE